VAYVMARAPLGFVLADTKKMQVLTMDPQTFSNKTGAPDA